ncbi:hypothetical protein niasHS_001662 [Heterodera schachtii]|uniref:Uncharacterized protein n=1 Tax=Heterodera schachtii TaxID=97005 RepID=A0ABD2KCH1_HETSC
MNEQTDGWMRRNEGMMDLIGWMCRMLEWKKEWIMEEEEAEWTDLCPSGAMCVRREEETDRHTFLGVELVERTELTDKDPTRAIGGWWSGLDERTHTHFVEGKQRMEHGTRDQLGATQRFAGP